LDFTFQQDDHCQVPTRIKSFNVVILSECNYQDKNINKLPVDTYNLLLMYEINQDDA